MGSGNSFSSMSSSATMAFSEPGWSSWVESPKPASDGDVSPGWYSDSKDRHWEHVPPYTAASQMTTGSFNKRDAADNIGVNIFSSSLPDLFHSKLGLVDVQSRSRDLEEEGKEDELSPEELELRAIGNLLPDDDELLAEISNGVPGSSSTQDSEELDIFGNSGGLELEGDGYAAAPTGEQASRTLFVRNIDSNVEDDELRAVFERFGDIRTLYTGCKHEGLVLVSYFDIRAARRAMLALQDKLLWSRNLLVHYILPKDLSSLEGNQGIFAVYNVDTAVSNDELKEIFGAFGDIKEVHESPLKQRERYIEYYDVRCAENALRALNRHDALGKRNKLDPRQNPGLNFDGELEEGQFQQLSPFLPSPGQLAVANGFLENASLRDLHQQAKLASFNHPLNPLPGSLPPHASSLMGKGGDLSPSYHSYRELDYGLVHHLRQSSALSALRSRDALEELALHRAASCFEHRGTAGIRPGLVGAAASSSMPFLWMNSQLAGPGSPVLWSPSAHFYAGQSKLHGGCGLVNPLGYSPCPYGDRLRRRGFLRQTTPGCTGLNSLRFGAGGSLARTHAERKGDLSKSLGRFGSRHRSRRGDSSATDKEQFQLDLDKIISGEDKRTTLMLKNIPNKYTSKMLLAVIDEANQGTYDFIYLPIDFKNKCNVGYAFVNMIDPSYIISFHKAFNGKKWEKFNSEKVASVAYARIQGKAALVAHFQNSSLMNECRPIVFGEDGNTPDDPGKEIGIIMGSEESADV